MRYQLRMTEQKESSEGSDNSAVCKKIIAKYTRPSTPRAVWQMVNTFGPYLLLWCLMYRCLTIFLVVASAVGRSGRRLSGAHFHHFS